MVKNSKDEVLTALVVEDDPEQLASDCKALGMRFLVLAATCGEDALRIARNAQPTVIVLDVMMPGGKDGFTVFRELHDDPATRGIPVIFLTAVNRATGLCFGPREIHRHLGAEPAAFLEKPVSADQLRRAVTEVAENRFAEITNKGAGR